MTTLMKKDRSLWPKVIQDFFGTDEFFDFEPGFGLMEKTFEVPSVNVKETEKAFKLEVSAPGFEKEDFDLQITDGILQIKAIKKTSKEEDQENIRKREFSYASIHREFRLPEEVVDEAVEANYKNGILYLTIPKQTETQPKVKKAIKVG